MREHLRRYSTVIVFGDADVSSPLCFGRLLGQLRRELDRFGTRLKVRGYVANEGRKNVAPRESFLSDRAIGRWLGSLEKGQFRKIDVYDALSSRTWPPLLYAGFSKLPDYVAREYTDESKLKANCNVTMAFEKSLLASRELDLEALAVVLAEEVEAFYGFIESDVAWTMQVHPQGGDRFIDMRWRDSSEVDYRRGKWSMRSMLPRLYWGNILTPAHIRRKVPDTVVGRLEEWGRERIYVRFVKDPQADPLFHEEVSQWFNVIPPIAAQSDS